jgi:hypothetical protein
MTFEEFFKKKKINLETLNQGDPGLLAEFKEHYEAMGEKSFDHTKKFWFNKLRRVYPLPPEVKTEKLRMENRLAEQTITEMLSEPAVHTAKAREQVPATEPAEKAVTPAGFKPRFKPGMPKPAELKEETAQPAEQREPATTAESTPSTAENAPKIGFKPRFKAGVTKPAEPAANEKAEEKSIEPTPEAEQPTATPVEAPKMGFKPRFKAGVTKPAQPTSEEGPSQEQSIAPVPEAEQPPVTPSEAPKMGFKPRFKAGVTKPAATPEEEKPEEKPTEESATQPEATTQSSTEVPKMGFKPRFKAGVTKPATEARETEPLSDQQTTAEDGDAISPLKENQSEEKPVGASSAPKGFKPRFKAGVTNKPKEAEEKGSEPRSATDTPEVNAAAEQQAVTAESESQAEAQPETPQFEKDKEQAQEQYGSRERENKHLSPEEGIADLENKKPAYKPRFNAKNFKPKSEE